MSKIDDIFYDLNSSDAYQFISETRDEYKVFEDKLKNKLPKEYGDISDACASYGAECERQGFINGFKYATLLAFECMK